MDSLKQKLSKTFNGSDEYKDNAVSTVSYKNFENPHFEMSGNERGGSVSLEASGSGENMFKSPNRRKYTIIIGTTVFIVLLIIIVGIAVGVTAGKDEKNAPNKSVTNQAELTTPTSEPREQSVSGSIRLLMNWSPDLTDPYSEKYSNTEREFIDTMEEVLKTDSLYQNDYVGVYVTDFKQGSVIVDFNLIITSSHPVTPEIVENTIKRSLTMKDGLFGNRTADPNSISVIEAAEKTTHPATTTTVKHMSSTVSTIKIPTAVPTTTARGTTVVPTTRETTPTSPPSETCSVLVHERCRNVLPYNTTTRSLQMQNVLLNDTGMMLNRLSICASDPNLVQYMICAYIAPECRTSQTGRVEAPVLPCRHMCMNVYDPCKEVLRNTTYMETVFNCDGYLPYPMRCNYVGPAPTTDVTTRPTTEQRCYPLHHTYCRNIPYNATYLPNYFGHTTLTDAYNYLSFVQAITDNGLYCHQHIHALYCSLLLPKCDQNYNRVPPCRSMCESVNERCLFLLTSLPVDLTMNCQRFPTTNCVGVSNTTIAPTGCDSTTQYTCDNGQCIPLEQRCDGVHACTDLSDEHSCVGTDECTEGQHRCTHSGLCIPPDWVCDSFNDCGDSSDEANCVCNATEHYVCKTVAGHDKCLDAENRCDGFPNCFNSTDEANCDGYVCRNDQFTCANGKCRPLRFVCDDDDDCGDNSDELNCSCPIDEFQCVNGTKIWGSAFVQTPCIPKLWRCDFQRDCSDGSDEINCPSVCASNPCKHGGTCLGDANDLGFRCVCPEKTAGAFCQDVLELPDITCYNEITVESCQPILAPYHNNTFSSPASQSQMSAIFNILLPKLSTCYEHAQLFVCQYTLPDCGSYGFLNQPCKHMCLEFKHRCSHILNETRGLADLFACESLMDNTVFPETQCFTLDHTQPTQIPPTTFNPLCEPLKSDYCKQLNWTTTYLPNYLNMTDQAAASLYLTQFEYAHTQVPACHRDLQKLGCSLLSPQCQSDSTGPIPPCRELCEVVEADCAYWLDHMQWNFPINCSMFPNSTNPDVCIQATPLVPVEGCGLDQFSCGSGECIHVRFTCDGTPDCQDGSDEDTELCGGLTCPPVYFDCKDNKTCILHAYRCDADFDCPVDNTTGLSIDEMDCVCDANQFACVNGVGCVRAEYQCDGINDCIDNSDEFNCQSITCPDNYQKCLNENRCIPNVWVCDEFDDCSGGTDEQGCSVCAIGAWPCENGVNKYTNSPCVAESWICDAEADCTDGSDENGCFPCDDNPCLYGGTCVEGPPTNKSYTCNCLPNTNGVNCEIATVMETARCNKEIALAQCKSVLSPFYTTTRVDIQLQATIGRHLTTDLLTRFDNCSSSSRLFFCGSEIPGCQNNGLPILPCKHTCIKFSQECRSQLRDSDLVFNCDHFPDTSLYPYAQCMYAPGTPLPTPSPNVNTSQCQSMKNQWCRSLGYNVTRIPNLLSLVSQAESEVYLNVFESLMSLNVRCHEALQLFACTVLAPNCNNKQPCEELCVEVTKQCTYLLQTVGFPLSLNCSVFPNYVNNEDRCLIHDTLIPECTNSEFTCAPGFCVPMRDRCDLWPDCNNGADELDCAPNECPSDNFFCRSNGDCIPGHWKCDEYDDCPGGEDELNCAGCPESQLMCSDNHTCYTIYQRCDLYQHCPDGGDELGCSDVVCNANQFRCHSGMCIPLAYKCDGERDCPGNIEPEDEEFCVSEDVCADDQFRCVDGVNGFNEESRCIPDSWRCDDAPDCTDYSDEQNCTQETACFGISCGNNGTCVETGPQTFTCQCTTGFTGQLCHMPVLPDYSCDHPVEIDECRTILPYNTTSSAPHIQTILSTSTKSVLARLNESACYDMASLFVCSSRFPACQANGLPLLPCRHVCLNFVEKCRNLLTEDGATDLLSIRCDTYPDYSTNTVRCLSGTDEPNPGDVPTAPRRCEQINNRFCSSLGYTQVSLPNYFAQSRQDEAALVLNLVDGLSSSIQCRRLLHTFMCALALPKCGTANNSSIPPCRDLCNDVLVNCSYWLNHYKFEIPLSCDSLPDSDNPDVCMLRPETTIVPTSHCAVNETKCLVGGCVPFNKTCNYNCDCSDCSDEENCFKQCPEDRLRCPNEYDKCLRTNWICDGYSDCNDQSDETDCLLVNATCISSQFACPATARFGVHCINPTWVCDGEVDCQGSEADEMNCTCEANQFKCDGSRCISSSWKCDRYTDCSDGTDEVGCGDGPGTEGVCFMFNHTLCANNMNRNLTQLPNLLGHTTQTGLEEAARSSFSSSLCSDYVNYFICASLFPKCGPFGPVYPCKEFCEQVVNHAGCGEVIANIFPNLSCDDQIFEALTCLN